ncbi:hypothetical protein DICVIV_03489 [Dictyocaulus viviparus]|uniref:Uncharacterized protein n=1 Tax=Dictyocaulus viviparus TaxID=29172 RepID=A0A0D8Y706_DICVI|nr:hypothetical protein DICVIV_03489 [Dictyocaulus viviparus]
MEGLGAKTDSTNVVSVTEADAVATISPRSGIAEEESVQLQSLYNKYVNQQKEIERLEEENSSYRDKLIKAIRERDLNGELLHSAQEAQKKESVILEKRIRDYEIQLKAVQDRATAQEAHYNVTIKDLSVKYNTSVNQLTKKLDISEKEKNDAVVKYATKEAELMRMRSDIQKKNQELVECQKAKEALELCQTQENVERLEKANNALRVEFEHTKIEKFDLENRLKMAEKRAEAYNATVSELKQQCDVLRKQLIQIKEEKLQLKEENRQLSSRVQEYELNHSSKDEDLNRSHIEMEQQLIEANTNYDRLNESNREISSRLEEVTRENLDFLKKLQDLEDRLCLEEESHAATSRELSRYRDLDNQMQSSISAYKKQWKELKLIKNKPKMTVKRVAEKEAEECRLQAEKMLSITDQLTQRNSQLASELAADREKNRCLEQQLIKTGDELDSALSKLSEKERELEKMSGDGQNEIISLKSELNDKLVKVQELTQMLQEERTDHRVTKKKYIAAIKELKHELQSLRKQMEANPNTTSLVPPNSADSVPSTSSRSRASSLNSLDRITTSRDEDNIHSGHSISNESNTIQQAMIDKIITLQKKLARRNDKLEFLEEHVRCCLEELQKKTRIIQHYALREEASLLLPSNGSLEQVPLSKKGASYSLMGSIFAASNEKKSLQLATEVNSRLQAVLEDILLKNITLKGSVDSLSNEVSRLARENRQLTLTHSRCSEQPS